MVWPHRGNGCQLAVNDLLNTKLMGNNLNHNRNVKSTRYVSLFCKSVVLFISLYQTLLKYCNIRTVSIGFLATCRTVELLKHCNIYKINLELELGRKMVFVSVVKRRCLAKWVQSSIFFSLIKTPFFSIF